MWCACFGSIDLSNGFLCYDKLLLLYAALMEQCSLASHETMAKIFALHIWDSVTQPAALELKVDRTAMRREPSQTPSGDCFPLFTFLTAGPSKVLTACR